MGSGAERRFVEKKFEGSGRIVELACGNTKGLCFLLWRCIVEGGAENGGGDVNWGGGDGNWGGGNSNGGGDVNWGVDVNWGGGNNNGGGGGAAVRVSFSLVL